MFSNQQTRPSGLPCPECGFFIETSLEDLLYKRSLTCPSCLLELTMDRDASQESIEWLQKLNHATQEIKKVQTFDL